jgi:hypothetical protein
LLSISRLKVKSLPRSPHYLHSARFRLQSSDLRAAFLELRLVESHPTVIIPLDDRVFFVSSLHCAEFSRWLSEVAHSLNAIPGFEFVIARDRLGEAWFPGAV